MQVTVFSKVDSAFPDGLTPVVRWDLYGFFTIRANFPDTWGKESVDVVIIRHGTSDICPVLLAKLFELTGFQVDLIDVVFAKSVAFAAHLDHHFGTMPGRVVLLAPFPAILALAHSSAPVFTDAHGISLVGDSSDAIAPVSLAKRLIAGIGKVQSVHPVLVHD